MQRLPVNRYHFFQPLFICILLVLSGCSIPPAKSTVEELIIKHFEKRQYKVTDVMIGDISPIAMGEKQYMGTEGYDVKVPLLTLEFTRDIGEPWNYKKGRHMTYHNGSVRIKRSAERSNEWIIINISGIPLP